MSKPILIACTIVLVVVLLVSATMVVINFASLSQDFESGALLAENEAAKYHFMVILDGNNEDYVEQFRQGAELAAKTHQVTFEFWDFSGSNKKEEILKQFDIGVYSQVDGIIVDTFVSDEYDFKDVLKRAYASSIPVVTLNEDIPNIEKVSHIGFNQYMVGSRISSVLSSANLSEGTIIILQNEDEIRDDKSIGVYENLKKTYEVRNETIGNTGENVLNAEGLTRQIINKYDKISAIICSDNKVTLGVVQAVKDANQVGNITVVGYGLTTDIREFMEKGVIFATVIADYQMQGYKSIESLVLSIEGSFVSSYQTVDVSIPSIDNLEIYLEEVGLKGEATDEEN